MYCLSVDFYLVENLEEESLDIFGIEIGNPSIMMLREKNVESYQQKVLPTRQGYHNPL